MPVFKTYLKIIKYNVTSVLINVVIFIALAILMSTNGQNTDVTSFKAKAINIGVVDQDMSQESTAVTEYLSTYHKIVTLEDNKEMMQDELYYRNIEYILIIPQQFGENLKTNTTPSIQCIKIPNSNSGFYVDLQLEQFLNTLKSFLIAGYDIDMAMSSAKDVLSTKTQVTLSLDESTSDTVSSYYYYFKFIPYIILALMIQTISTNLYIFNKPDLKRRNICSSLSLKSRNFQLGLGSFFIAFLIYLVLVILGLLLYKESMIQTGVISYYILNSFTFLIVSISIAYLVGIISNNLELISVFSTILSLAFSFLGGVFVPLSVMSENVLTFAKFVPTYWYTIVNDTMMKLTRVTSVSQKDIFTGIFIQLCFALAFFSIALVISKKKAEQVSI